MANQWSLLNLLLIPEATYILRGVGQTPTLSPCMQLVCRWFFASASTSYGIT